MNLRGVDLNLLVILDALLEEAHVSRAATRLGLSQPATSSALERARHLFGDPLLERRPGGMRLTPKALALREPLREALDGVGGVLAIGAPDLASVERTVHVLMADVLGALITSALFPRVHATAPGISLVLHPWSGGAAAVAAMAKGRIDLALSVLPPVEDAAVYREAILQETYVVAMRADHPAARDFGLDGWLAHPHVLVSSGGERRGALDQALEAIGRERRIGITVPSFLLVPELLRTSDLIALLPSLCVRDARKEQLELFPPPVRVDGFTLHIGWPRRRDNDIAVRHVAAVARAVLEERGGTGR